jgi:hypothetical protein
MKEFGRWSEGEISWVSALMFEMSPSLFQIIDVCHRTYENTRTFLVNFSTCPGCNVQKGRERKKKRHPQRVQFHLKSSNVWSFFPKNNHRFVSDRAVVMITIETFFANCQLLNKSNLQSFLRHFYDHRNLLIGESYFLSETNKESRTSRTR